MILLAENLIMLRNVKGLTQEQVAEIAGVSRQSYAKWEQGDCVPDIEKCDRLARITPPPEGKFLWGTVKMGNKGQIVIPKEARETYGLKEGERLVVLGDKEGIALVQAEKFEQQLRNAMELSRKLVEE